MRFTLAACLALMAFVAVLCFLLTTQASVASYFLLLAITLLAPVSAVAGIVYGRDNLRAFCIGPTLPLALLVWSSSHDLREISFDPAAYGWSSPKQQPAPQDLLLSLRTGGRMSGTGVSAASGIQGSVTLVRQPVYDRTLNQAQAMTGPTCSLAIAAVVCGVVVMAIRGVLQRKESDPSQRSSVSL